MKIKLTFSEAPGFKPQEFSSFRDANRFLNKITPPPFGYYKTDFVISEFDEEKNTYSGRYDIGPDFPTLQEHVMKSIEGMRNRGIVKEEKDIKSLAILDALCRA